MGNYIVAIGFKICNSNDINEDDDLWIDTQKPKDNCNNICINNDIIINIIRIPKVYYSINFDLSFYWLCCRISK